MFVDASDFKVASVLMVNMPSINTIVNWAKWYYEDTYDFWQRGYHNRGYNKGSKLYPFLWTCVCWVMSSLMTQRGRIPLMSFEVRMFEKSKRELINSKKKKCSYVMKRRKILISAGIEPTAFLPEMQRSIACPILME